ncbi:chemotaxis protein CheB [Caldimonas brevitalea]|uniref:protein-glutamate methylesterase n=1 Tax=Caldimonas brevitalea TaxID=413882 RepID=A0A0G3BK64_9BURK|nr:chemotaxis protein CheB [Caldimonas brevitalea]AKJ29849.1 chemotaxis response regulator protein-glutamate methylesterase CheB [Caldimonas brevitalea]
MTSVPPDLTPPRPVDAVVIGASAGGVEALGLLLAALPPGFGAPVLVVLHVPPQRANHLAQLFGARCALPVVEAQDKQPLRPGTVYLAPPDYHLLVEPDFCVALSVDAPVHFSRPAIDPLFESAAAAYGSRLLAIVLTGASSDGSQGLRAVRKAGGQAWVQNPADAQVPTMPAAALKAAGADAILSLTAIAHTLAGLTTQAPVPPDNVLRSISS